MEEQLKKNKEELVSNFFTTTSKFKKTQGSQNDTDCKSPGPATPSSHAPYSGYPAPGQSFPFPPVVAPQVMANSGQTPFLVQPMAFLNQHKHLQYGNGIVQFYHLLAYEQTTIDTQTSVNTYLKNLMFYIHQKFLIVICITLSRIVNKKQSSWETSL